MRRGGRGHIYRGLPFCVTLSNALVHTLVVSPTLTKGFIPGITFREIHACSSLIQTSKVCIKTVIDEGLKGLSYVSNGISLFFP